MRLTQRRAISGREKNARNFYRLTLAAGADEARCSDVSPARRPINGEQARWQCRERSVSAAHVFDIKSRERRCERKVLRSASRGERRTGKRDGARFNSVLSDKWISFIQNRLRRHHIFVIEKVSKYGRRKSGGKKSHLTTDEEEKMFALFFLPGFAYSSFGGQVRDARAGAKFDNQNFFDIVTVFVVFIILRRRSVRSSSKSSFFSPFNKKLLSVT